MDVGRWMGLEVHDGHLQELFPGYFRKEIRDFPDTSGWALSTIIFEEAGFGSYQKGRLAGRAAAGRRFRLGVWRAVGL